MSDEGVLQGGSGGPLMVLLHGMGASAAVWEPFLDASDWPGRWIAVDLPGHGRAPPLDRYSYGGHAARVAEQLGTDHVDLVVGHSLGGAVALALASGWFGLQITKVVSIAMRVAPWSDNDLGTFARLSARPPRWYDERSAALERALRVAGLSELADTSSAVADRGVISADGCFRAAWDPSAATTAATAPSATAMLANVDGTPIHVVATAATEALDAPQSLPGTVTQTVFDGVRHNVHVEHPADTWEVVSAFWTSHHR